MTHDTITSSMTSGLITSLAKKQSYFLNGNIQLSFTFSTKLDVYNIHITREQKNTKTYLKKNNHLNPLNNNYMFS